MYPFKLILTLLFACTFSDVAAQHCEKQLVLAFEPGVLSEEHEMVISIDSNNNYCYYQWNGNGRVVTNTGSYGPFAKQDVRTFTLFYNQKGKDQYIKGRKKTRLIGPVNGAIRFATLLSDEYFAFSVTNRDSVSFYVNERLVGTIDTALTYDDNHWCAFSKSGNVLYTLAGKSRNYLYLNYRIVDSSKEMYFGLGVDDINNYRFELGRWEVQPGNCFSSFHHSVHAAQKILGPVSPGGSIFMGDGVEFRYNDTVNYYGNGDGLAYSINDSLAVKLRDRRNVMIPGKGKNFLLYPQDPFRSGMINPTLDTTTWMIADGRLLNLKYSELLLPAIDTNGNFAFFGQRNYYLYKNVNGQEDPEPLSKFGVRAWPISIDENGNTICCYQTDDSTYIYENDRLFRSCGNAEFDLLNQNEIVGPFNTDALSTVRMRDGLSGFTVKDSTYIVYHNAISPPLLKTKNRYRSEKDTVGVGGIITCEYGEHGYWLIQKTGHRQYTLMINNKVYPMPTDAELETILLYTLQLNSSLTDNNFTMYYKQGDNIWRYKIDLCVRN